MTSEPLPAEGLAALIAMWRRRIVTLTNTTDLNAARADTFRACANQLEAALAPRVARPVPQPKAKFRPHERTCPAYSNYQPPYEACDCGADDSDLPRQEPQP